MLSFIRFRHLRFEETFSKVCQNGPQSRQGNQKCGSHSVNIFSGKQRRTWPGIATLFTGITRSS